MNESQFLALLAAHFHGRAAPTAKSVAGSFERASKFKKLVDSRRERENEAARKKAADAKINTTGETRRSPWDV